MLANGVRRDGMVAKTTKALIKPPSHAKSGGFGREEGVTQDLRRSKAADVLDAPIEGSENIHEFHITTIRRPEFDVGTQTLNTCEIRLIGIANIKVR